MDKYWRKNYIEQENLFDKDIDMHIIEWWAQDEEDEDEEEDESSVNSDYAEYNKKPQIKNKYVIRCFGATKNGTSITCKITGFTPYYYIKVEPTFNNAQLQRLTTYMQESYLLKGFKTGIVKDKCKIEKKKDLFGFRNGTYYKYVKLVFDNYSALMKSRYIFKKPIQITGVTTKPTKYKLYESNFDGFMRYCHIKDIQMAGWIRLPANKYEITSDTTSTQIEIKIDRNDVVSLKETQDIAKFLQASWDIEVYSHDYTFPAPQKKIKDINGNLIYPNEIFQIATTYKYSGDSGTLIKHLLTLKKCASIDNVIVEECKTEKELIKRWVDTISMMDPDIFYTYNGDSFDCMYLIERAVIYGQSFKEYIISKLSRLSHTSCTVKKETFSSSAYGDSEFIRLYIPGRLNYDLLIHYKRGMKKYSSYKLDNIANEILKEGKHNVSAKEIFGYYEEGTPEQIRHIGQYCIQDTELLQKLVDKQIILTTIMQLANVTFVPIGFLTTRGQTIKVFSQLLRKARQMDFLVPHTNFNEDSYSLLLKMNEPHNFEESHINSYVDIIMGNTFAKELENQNLKPIKNLTARVSQIVDESTIIVLTDTELTKEYHNRTLKYKNKQFTIKQLIPNEDAVDDSFTGATVLHANSGLYTDNIVVLDFASLYPTIMISRNLCYSTFLMNNKFKNLPNVNYETIAWDDKIEFKMKQTCEGVGKSGKSKGLVCGKQAFFEIDNKYYCRIHDTLKKSREDGEKHQKRNVSYNYTVVQPHLDKDGNKVNLGVLPAMLEELYSERKKVKRQMAQAIQDNNKVLADILDSTQLAIKVSLNSTYGFLGRCQGNLILKELGSIVTSVGRQLIEQSKEYAEGQFLEYVKENELTKHQVQCKKHELSDTEKQKLLNHFQIK